MRKTKRGLSFLELVMAMSMTFLAMTLLVGTFLTGLRHSGKSREMARATGLAQARLERLSALTMDSIQPGSWPIGTDTEHLTYRVDVADAGDYDGDGLDDPDFKMVTVTVFNKDEPQCRLATLKPAISALYGAECSANQDQALFCVDDSAHKYPAGWDDPSGQLDPAAWFLFASDATLPEGGRPAGVAASDDLQTVWVVDFIKQGIRKATAPSNAWSACKRPCGLGTPTGLCGRSDLSELWLGDGSNYCLWSYRPATDSWSGPLRPCGLGKVTGVATRPLGQVVWLADADHHCLRKYTPATDTWDATSYTSPELGELVAVALREDGQRVYAMDERYLHWLDLPSATWSKVPLPAKLRSDTPQGLALNYAGTLLWASPRRGPLYKYDVTADTWTELNGP